MTAPESASRTAPRGADAWFTPGRFALLLAGLIVLTFPGILSGQETFFLNDFGVFGYPLAQFHRDAFWRGAIPLWNPLNWCGLPFLAQWNTLTLYPPALLYLLFPLSWSLAVFNLAHLFLAGMGMYFLARRWTGNALAAAVAGVVFGYNGLTWHSLMWPNDIAALGWMPWVVLATERAWNEGGRAMTWAALVGALQMLSGAPEIILLTWIFLGALWLTQFIWNDLPRLQMTRRSALVVMFVAGLAAAQLLPFLDLLAHSHRDQGFGGADWPMPFSGIANFLAPLFHCTPDNQGVFRQHDQYWTSSYYLGVGTMVLTAAACWRVKDRRVWLLLAVTVGSVWMALGTAGHLYVHMKKILPLLGLMRYPIKFIVLAVFCIPLLAAFAVKQQRQNPSLQSAKLLMGLAGVLLCILAGIAWFDWRHPEPLAVWTVSWHNLALRAFFLLAVPALLLVQNRADTFKMQLGLGVGLVLLLWFDIYTHAPNLSPTVKRSVYEPGLIRGELKLPTPAPPGETRFMASTAAMEQLYFHSVSNPANDYLCRRLAFAENCNLLDAVSKVDGFYSLYLKDMAPVITLLNHADEQNIDLKGLKDFLSVAHVNPPGTSPDRALEWVTRDTALPLVTAGQMPIFTDETKTLAALGRTNFNPVENVYLPMAASGSITARRSDSKIISQKIAAEDLSVTLDSPTPALVVISQAYYHPWHAYVDGKPTPLWKANYAFQAAEMPAGRHELRVVYEDAAFRYGLVISLGSWLLTALGLICLKNKPSTPDPGAPVN